MRVVAAQVVDVERRQRVIDEALEELVHEVDVERADQRARERHVELEARPARKVDHDARQRFVERNVRVAVAADADLVAERGFQRLPERDADVLDRVMRVDVQVALRAHGEVESCCGGRPGRACDRERESRSRGSSRRAVNYSQNGFFRETFIDELAYASKQDPYQFRRPLLAQAPRTLAVLDEAARRASWGKAQAGVHQGIAVVEFDDAVCAQVVEISVDKEPMSIA